jgi:hypothetical protein
MRDDGRVKTWQNVTREEERERKDGQADVTRVESDTKEIVQRW